MINKYIKKRVVLLIFLCVIFIISLLVGIVIYIKCSNDVKILLENSLLNLKYDLLNNHINNIFNHLLIIFIIIILSLSIIGYFSGIIYLFYEGLSIGFTMSFLVSNYGIKGFIFCIIYNGLFKIIFLLLFIFLLCKLYDLVKNIIVYFLSKKRIRIFDNVKKIIKSIILIIIFILIFDLTIYIFGNFLLKIIVNVL